MSFVRLPVKDGFFFDTRPKGERKVMNPAWKTKNGKHILRFEIADKNDLNLVANFFNYHFTRNNSLREALGATYEEMEHFSYDRAAKVIEKPSTWLVFEDNKLVAADLHIYYTPDEYYQLFNGELFHENPKFIIKEDYAVEIKNGPYNNLNANRIFVLSNECFKQIGKFLPKDVKNLSFGSAIGVHPTFMRSGLAEYLLYEIFKDLQNLNCNYSVGFCTAYGSYEACKKLGMKELFCLQYKDYKENGKPVFENLSDNAKGCHVVLLDVNKFLKTMVKHQPKEKGEHSQKNNQSKI